MNTLHFKKVDENTFQRELIAPTGQIIHTCSPELIGNNLEILFADYVKQMKEITSMEISTVSNDFSITL